MEIIYDLNCRYGQVIFDWIPLLLINIPFLVIRIEVKANYDNQKGDDYFPLSLMVIKNVLYILSGIRTIVQLSRDTRETSAQDNTTNPLSLSTSSIHTTTTTTTT